MPEDYQENKALNEYFRNVDKYSKSHIDDISLFSKLLESLKKEKITSENSKYVSDIRTRVNNFNSLISKYNLKLTESETEDINTINNSGASPILKLRMLEDLFHKIQKNHKNEIDTVLSPDHVREIEVLNRKRSFFVEWIHLFVFSVNFRTITPFSHNIKESSLALIKGGLHENILQVRDFLKNLLDKEYYIFSIVEYNTLVLILELEPVIDDLKKNYSDLYYNPRNLKDIMFRFCDIYLKILFNAGIIDDVTLKLSSNRKLPHGFYGTIKSIIEQPLHNGKTVKLSPEAKITRTPGGTILSYYTSLEKKVFTSLYQVKHLLNISTSVNKNTKNLTGSAAEAERNQHNIDSEDMNTNETKFRKLRTIFEYYIPLGREIYENITKEETFSASESWHKSYENKAMYRPVQLIEALIRHFTERITTPNSIIFRYDHREFQRYFEHKKEIFNAAKGISIVDLELTAANLKEIYDADPPLNVDNDDFIPWLLTHDKSHFSNLENYSLTKNFLNTVQSRVFSLASTVFEVIESYENNKQINFQLTEENYDFFINAEIAAHRQLTLSRIIAKEPITVESFLKALCAISYYAAEVFCSGALAELKNEIERLHSVFKTPDDEMETNPDLSVPENEITEQEEEAGNYIDSLTGLYKFQYFNDILKPQQYTDSLRYNLDSGRFMFFLEIQNFQVINNRMGHDTGDQLLSKCSRILQETAGQHEGISLFRYKNANIFGTFQTTDLNEVLNYVRSAAAGINKLSASTAQYSVRNISINCGIYEEKKAGIFSSTFEITRRLMHSGTNTQANNIVMTRNRNVKINKKYFMPDGSISPVLLKVIQ
ncbi:MAG: diguanylate cyclase [Spirochaetes bacterium]|nr:diguanylate cyclase [Spirochaetota bacterium]